VSVIDIEPGMGGAANIDEAYIVRDTGGYQQTNKACSAATKEKWVCPIFCHIWPRARETVTTLVVATNKLHSPSSIQVLQVRTARLFVPPIQSSVSTSRRHDTCVQ
jgi:hypothetical protein